MGLNGASRGRWPLPPYREDVRIPIPDGGGGYSQIEQFDWKKRVDPTVRAARKVKTDGIKPPEINEEQAQALLRKLLATEHWRVAATAAVSHASARRVGAVAGARPGLHLDAQPLCASDFKEHPNGTVEVTWRAEVQKARGYGRGDVTQEAPKLLVETYRWLVACHPNPLGPEHPLIWSEADPSSAESYSTLRNDLKAGWRETFGEEMPKGLLWHGFWRGTITTIADEISIEAAAEFSGRTVRVTNEKYKRVRPETLAKTARRLEESRGERFTFPAPPGNPERNGTEPKRAERNEAERGVPA